MHTCTPQSPPHSVQTLAELQHSGVPPHQTSSTSLLQKESMPSSLQMELARLRCAHYHRRLTKHSALQQNFSHFPADVKLDASYCGQHASAMSIQVVFAYSVSGPLATDAGFDAFAVPIIMGSVAQLGDLEFESATRHLTGSLTLIARRSLRRAGTRHWRRGADLQVSSSACHVGALQDDLHYVGSVQQ